MSDQANHYDGGTAPDLREDIGYVCDQLDRIRAALAAYGLDGAAPLDRLLAALRDGEGLAAPLSALHEALLAAGDAAGVRGTARGLNPIGVGPATPDEWVLLCPTRQCSRHAWPDSSGATPCRISGQPLRKERL
ncbi:hypothetical protein [Streptomyces brasiliensis]|uniref:Uncharacterized protein n=1 Tax=Streptomyces brasiliensis TaxID=1954 RepID=A0A917NTY2_9ACTN|nr:hypothetical protein [Streptomyces brasiliensis]GGJ27924.1 hypothetical protein GCM10010121_044060 [Streptomyces brasiliensis]